MSSKKKTKFFWTSLDKKKDGKVKDGQIRLKATSQTSVWSKRDGEGKGQANAPFYFRKVTGDFQAMVKVTSHMNYWLDAAGLLIRGEKLGIYNKIGLEYHNSPTGPDSFHYYAAAYVHKKKDLETNINNLTPYPGQWSKKDKRYSYVELQELDPLKKVEMWFSAKRVGSTIEAMYSFDGKEWMPLRQSKFTNTKTLSVGVYAASGLEEHGVKVTFEKLKIEEDPDWEDCSSSSESEEEEEEDIPVHKRASKIDFIKRMQEQAEEELRQMKQNQEEEMFGQLEKLNAELGADTGGADVEGGQVDFDVHTAVKSGRRSSSIRTTPILTLFDSDDDDDSDSD